MNPKPKWIGKKLTCKFPGCGREMFRRDLYCLCEVPGHGGLFPVPEKPKLEPQKPDTWKESLAEACQVGRKQVRVDGERTSFGVWKLKGNDVTTYRMVRLHVRETDSVPDGCIVCRYSVGCGHRKQYRTVLLKRFEDVE